MKLYQDYSVSGYANSYILGDGESGEAILVDPAEVTSTMIEQIEHNHYHLSTVLITHNHLHHVRGLRTLFRIYSPQVYASNTRLLDIPCRKVKDQEVFSVADWSVLAIAVPGHSQDSIVYKIGNLLFTGDVLHAGIIGKTTSTFNTEALIERIKDKLLKFPDDTLILPGHGPPTTIGTERKHNLGFMKGYAEALGQSYVFFV
ncbi:MAG TPA: MBL fold metallo-hydrolase [Spirochaetales bacterium]|nr:MBL fold metallo-hydrolase [Spirochaetales bacterium]HPS14350.1 MBL fold metallo-hydrolase [Spirochaetales bacterium]